MQKLRIVIVNWNAGQQLADCVVSILGSQQNNFVFEKIIIVDNASTDNSLDLLPQNNKMHIIRNSQNYGFGKACNLGAKVYGSADLLLFLNPDTILKLDTLDISIKFYNENAKKMRFGILGVKLVYDDGSIQKSCSRFPSVKSEVFDSTGLSKLFPATSSHMNEFSHHSSRFVEQIMGAYFLTSNPLFERLGGFDESFFVYYEEVDFSYRARGLGYNSYFLADVSAVHVGGGCSRQVKAKRLFYSLNSRLIYVSKHFSKMDSIIVYVLTLIIEPCTRIAFSLLKGSVSGVKETIEGYIMLYKKLLAK